MGDKVPSWEVLLEHVPGLTRDQRERAKQRLIQEHPNEAVRRSYLLVPEEARLHILTLLGEWNVYVELCYWLFGAPFNQCSESPSPKPGGPHGGPSESSSVGPTGGPSESSSAGPSWGASGGPSTAPSGGASEGPSGGRMPYWELLLEHIPGLTRDQRERAKQHLIRAYPCDAIRESYLLLPEEGRRHILRLLGEWNIYVELFYWLSWTSNNQCSDSPSSRSGGPHGGPSESISVGPSGGPSESSSAGPSGGASAGPSESSSVGPSGGASGDKVPYWEVLLEHVPGLTRDQRERAKQRLIQEHPTEAIRQSYLLFPEEARRHVLKLIGDWNTYVELCSWLFGTPFNQCSESPSPKPGAPHGSLSESISVGPSGGPSESSSAGPSGGASGDKMPYWEVLLEHVPGLTRDQRERAKQHLIREHPTEGARVLHLIFPAEARRHILMLLGEWNVYVELCYWLFGTSNNQCSESPSPKPGGPHDSPSESPFGSPCRGASEGPIYNMQPAVGQRLGNPKAHLHQRKVYSGVLQT